MTKLTGGKKCRTGKVRYRDAIAAKLALARTSSGTRTGRDEAHVYRCAMCRGWHLTSQPQRPRGVAE